MKTQSQALPAARVTLMGFARHFVERIAAAAAARHARRREKAIARRLEQMDARLLDDIGLVQPKKSLPLAGVAQLNPVVVAATAFSLPRSRRR